MPTESSGTVQFQVLFPNVHFLLFYLHMEWNNTHQIPGNDQFVLHHTVHNSMQFFESTTHNQYLYEHPIYKVDFPRAVLLQKNQLEDILRLPQDSFYRPTGTAMDAPMYQHYPSQHKSEYLQ